MVRANNEHRQLRGPLSGIRGGEVWRTGARAGLGGIAGHDLGHVSSPVGGAAARASRPARRSETVLRALQKDLPGTIQGAF